jgi:hypothetical protein
MTVHYHALLTQQLSDGVHRRSHDPQGARAASRAVVDPSSLDDHDRQRMLIRASLLLGVGRDKPTSRRWA